MYITPYTFMHQACLSIDLALFTSSMSVDIFARHAPEVITVLLVPIRQFVRLPRPSDPWFDRECRDAERLTWRLRCIHAATVRSAAAPCRSTAATTLADDEHRHYVIS
jgi:hypothetical protein